MQLPTGRLLSNQLPVLPHRTARRSIHEKHKEAMEGSGKEEYERKHKQENTSMFALQNQKSKLIG